MSTSIKENKTDKRYGMIGEEDWNMCVVAWVVVLIGLLIFYILGIAGIGALRYENTHTPTPSPVPSPAPELNSPRPPPAFGSASNHAGPTISKPGLPTLPADYFIPTIFPNAHVVPIPNLGPADQKCINDSMCANLTTCATCLHVAHPICNLHTNICMIDPNPGGCAPGWGDCNLYYLDGCETNVTADGYNCGSCFNICQGNHTDYMQCANNVCQTSQYNCTSGWGDCYNTTAQDAFCETQLTLDAFNCGSCGYNCYTQTGEYGIASWKCVYGQCRGLSCEQGWTACNGDITTHGCQNLLWDNNNCGTCGNVCPAHVSCCYQGQCHYTASRNDAASPIQFLLDKTSQNCIGLQIPLNNGLNQSLCQALPLNINNQTGNPYTPCCFDRDCVNQGTQKYCVNFHQYGDSQVTGQCESSNVVPTPPAPHCYNNGYCNPPSICIGAVLGVCGADCGLPCASTSDCINSGCPFAGLVSNGGCQGYTSEGVCSLPTQAPPVSCCFDSVGCTPCSNQKFGICDLAIMYNTTYGPILCIDPVSNNSVVWDGVSPLGYGPGQCVPVLSTETGHQQQCCDDLTCSDINDTCVTPYNGKVLISQVGGANGNTFSLGQSCNYNSLLSVYNISTNGIAQVSCVSGSCITDPIWGSYNTLQVPNAFVTSSSSVACLINDDCIANFDYPANVTYLAVTNSHNNIVCYPNGDIRGIPLSCPQIIPVSNGIFSQDHCTDPQSAGNIVSINPNSNVCESWSFFGGPSPYIYSHDIVTNPVTATCSGSSVSDFGYCQISGYVCNNVHLCPYLINQCVSTSTNGTTPAQGTCPIVAPTPAPTPSLVTCCGGSGDCSSVAGASCQWNSPGTCSITGDSCYGLVHCPNSYGEPIQPIRCSNITQVCLSSGKCNISNANCDNLTNPCTAFVQTCLNYRPGQCQTAPLPPEVINCCNDLGCSSGICNLPTNSKCAYQTSRTCCFNGDCSATLLPQTCTRYAPYYTYVNPATPGVQASDLAPCLISNGTVCTAGTQGFYCQYYAGYITIDNYLAGQCTTANANTTCVEYFTVTGCDFGNTVVIGSQSYHTCYDGGSYCLTNSDCPNTVINIVTGSAPCVYGCWNQHPIPSGTAYWTIPGFDPPITTERLTSLCYEVLAGQCDLTGARCLSNADCPQVSDYCPAATGKTLGLGGTCNPLATIAPTQPSYLIQYTD